jgi:hypothetical protein
MAGEHDIRLAWQSRGMMPKAQPYGMQPAAQCSSGFVSLPRIRSCGAAAVLW